MRSEVCRNQALRRIYQMNIESERAAFEAWMVEVEGVRIKPRFDRATAGPFAGDYRDGQVQGAWNVWQARAALSANHSEQVRECSLSRESLTLAYRLITKDLETLANGSAIDRFKSAQDEFRSAIAAAPSAGSQEKE